MILSKQIWRQNQIIYIDIIMQERKQRTFLASPSAPIFWFWGSELE